ncbi:AraC family transcriptional regulator [Bacillus sp. TL12]|uniref:DUF6944 family repetitive protein n=1 Tax=Bacillus sp. TL12 TaxID=2894756 RepID=UPI001F51920F|nr:AraC family transcriptional regulator [Bacillus sp. TL12]MCI0765375.1 AraC family transcriptional regulator [Bacillus sp. TL12]
MGWRSLTVTGAWFQAGGNIISAIGGTRAFIGEEDVEDALTIVGESVQAIGGVLQGLEQTEDTEGKTENKEDTKQPNGSFKKTENEDESIEKSNDSIEETGTEMQLSEKLGCSLGRTSAFVQALGNTSDVIGTALNLENEEKENDYLIIAGNSLQSFGAFLAVVDELRDTQNIQWLGVIGNSLQTVGAGLQAFQALYNVLEEEEMEKKNENDKESSNNQKNEEEKKENKVDEQLIGLIGSWVQATGAVLGAIGETIEPED